MDHDGSNGGLPGGPDGGPDEGPDAWDVLRAALGRQASVRAARRHWDADADAYQAEHGDFLGDADFVWGPEGLREADARLLGDVAGRRVLEVGCGAAQCARWLRAQGAAAVGVDVSAGQLRHARRLDGAAGARLALVQADAARLPLAAGAFDAACSAYGAVPFVADAGALHAEVRRVLRPGATWAFSVPHPVRWCFPDSPGPEGLVASLSYFDRRAYVEADAAGRPGYAEHHRTLGDQVRALVAAGFAVVDVVEPEWPAGHTRSWGGWSPLRGAVLPGTAVFVARAV